ncbi:MAG: hypothetical protein ACI91F_000738 [Candidatus Binatia bacterium]
MVALGLSDQPRFAGKVGSGRDMQLCVHDGIQSLGRVDRVARALNDEVAGVNELGEGSRIEMSDRCGLGSTWRPGQGRVPGTWARDMGQGHRQPARNVAASDDADSGWPIVEL